MTALLRNATDNQIVRRVNESGNLYAKDIDDLRQNYDRIWDRTEKILAALAGVR